MGKRDDLIFTRKHDLMFSDDRSASNGMNPDFLAFACADQAVPAVHVFFSASEPFINAFGEHECGAGWCIFLK